MGLTIRLGLTQPLRGWYHVRSSGCNRVAVENISRLALQREGSFKTRYRGTHKAQVDSGVTRMQTLKSLVQFVLLIGVSLTGASLLLAQDADLLRHFDYDQKAPLGIKRIGVQQRTSAIVYDITYASPKGGVVPAYLVVPKGRGPFAAVIWGHWCWQNSSLRNRKQFLDEAVALAKSGLVSLLTDHPMSRPGHVGSKDPLDEQDANDFLQQVIDMRRGLDLLTARKDVDPKRIAFVGHSCNAGVGALLSGLDRR